MTKKVGKSIKKGAHQSNRHDLTSKHRQKCVNKIDNDTAEDGDWKEAEAEPCSNEADDEGDDACEWGEGGLDDGRKGHHGEGDIGNVVEETAQEGVADGSLDEQHGQDANQVCDQNRQEDVEDRAILFHLIRCF